MVGRKPLGESRLEEGFHLRLPHKVIEALGATQQDRIAWLVGKDGSVSLEAQRPRKKPETAKR